MGRWQEDVKSKPDLTSREDQREVGSLVGGIAIADGKQ